MATSWSQTRFAISQQILLLFITLDGWHHSYHLPLMLIWSGWRGWKNHYVLPPKRWQAQISDFSEFQLSKEKSMASQLWSPNTSTSVESRRKRAYLDAKSWVHYIFPFFTLYLAEISTFSYHLSQFSCKHAAINCERGGKQQLGRKVRDLWAYQQ